MSQGKMRRFPQGSLSKTAFQPYLDEKATEL
jgi:hypothetical protein